MITNVLATAAGLSDQDLLTRLRVLASREREATVELVAHLAALDARPAVYAAQGYGSLFRYCSQALRLSEDAACNRIEAARACRRFPSILDLLASGALTLTSLRLLGRHLTTENHQTVLAQASGHSRQEIEVLVAALAPRPDVPSSVRKLRSSPPPSAAPAAASSIDLQAPLAMAPAAVAPGPTPRAIVQPTAPERYRVQFTIGLHTHERLRRLQELLRREIPDGDPGAIFDRALRLLLEKVEKEKLETATHTRSSAPIRPGTDRVHESAVRSRYIPRAVKRVVWRRDRGQCAFMSPEGQRCSERSFLEFHHVRPYAERGPATVTNISLRCRRHNQYEAESIFGSWRPRSAATRASRTPGMAAGTDRSPGPSDA
jgi:hypothetical protein